MNQDLVNNFEILRQYFYKKGDRGRAIAYNKAVVSARSLPFKITSVDQVKGVKGIGPKLRAKIKEYLETGRIRTADDKKEELAHLKKKTGKEKVLEDLQTVWGVGPAKAKHLYEEGIRSFKDLKKNHHLLNEQQHIGLKYREDFLQKVPRGDITVLSVIMRYVLNKSYGRDNYDLKIAGSYRRGKEESGDIDCLVTSTVFDLSDMVKVLTQVGIITDTLSMRDEKFMGVAHCPGGGMYIRLDIEFLPKSEWASGLLYFTGSRGFNVMMRSRAKKKGYKLTQHGLFEVSSGSLVPSKTEKDLFDSIGMEYVPPERR